MTIQPPHPPPLLPLTRCFVINENKVQYCIGGVGDESLGLWGKKYWREVSEIAVLHRQRYKKMHQVHC